MPNLQTKNLHTTWARQLHAEFHDICWKYGVPLTAPVIEISHATKQFGSWTPGSRTVKISTNLITNYSWAVTIHVLKHEMAHQICSEIFKDSKPGHDQNFQKACTLIGVPDPFRGAGGDLPENVAMPETDHSQVKEGRRFIEKLEKLLALADSCNEHEAALAMRKANEFIQKYNLGQIHAKQRHTYTFVIINNRKKQIQGYQRQICKILSDFFFVRVILSDLYDPLTDQIHKTIELLGKKENVKVAEYCYHFLENQLKLLWEQNRQTFNGATRTEKNSYYLGLLKGFYTKLKQHQKPCSTKASPASGPEKTIGALIVKEDKDLSKYIKTRFPRIRHVSHAGPKIYASTYQNGIQKGKNIVLHKGVTQKKANSGRMLPR